MRITPADPAISVGQTQQFTASGAITAAGVSAGGEYTCVRLPNGTAQCAGRNQFGQLADGTWTNSSVLVRVSGLTTATRVAAGDEFGCAILADGTARCWGLGENGQRGDGTFDQIALVPVAVSGLTNAVSVTAGYDHACALLADGTMRCWGSNLDGQLGNPSTGQVKSSVPVTVTGITGAAAITAGAYHTCALLADSTLRCWGQNGQAQLGNGTRTNSSAPVPVSGITGVAAVSGGGVHTCAALRDGTVRCWGENQFGQLGDGTTTSSTTPVPVVGITGAVGVTAGWRHACALLGDGAVQCWGENAFGQLGDGTTTNSSTPVRVRGITGAVGVTAGWWHHSCAVLADGTVQCWGVNEWGQFGNGTTTGSSSPVTMSRTGVTWTSSNTAVATIGTTGRATGVSAGLTTITATDTSGATASTTLTVRDRVTLSVLPAGAGMGSVTSSPPGIDCGTDCSEPYDSGTTVTLTASAASNSNFAGWGGCDTVSGTTCTVTMSAARVVTAIFDLKRFTLTVDKTGLARDSGSVSSSPQGIDCGTDCSEPYTIDTVVTLTASPSVLLSGWSGCDSVSGSTCTVTMRSARTVAASFVGMPF
jgi:alpha-tubulin suppressor-like RCC1 family protein